MTETLFSL